MSSDSTSKTQRITFILLVLVLCVLAVFVFDAKSISLNSSSPILELPQFIDETSLPPPSISKSPTQIQSASRNDQAEIAFARKLRKEIFDESTNKQHFVGSKEKFLAAQENTGRPLCILLLLGFDEEGFVSDGNSSPPCLPEFQQDQKHHSLSIENTLIHCVLRVGISNFENALNPKCVQSEWWKSTFSSSSSKSKSNQTNSIPQDYLRKSQTILTSSSSSTESSSYIPPQRRTYARVHPQAQHHFVDFKLPAERSVDPSRITLRGYPIGFGIPRQMIVRRVSRIKLLALTPITAGWLGGRKNYPKTPKKFLSSSSSSASSQYSLEPSEEYTLAQLYRHSYFAFTMVRGGGDAQRHLEILARGCVPFFPDLAFRCHPTASPCLALYPKELMKPLVELVQSASNRNSSSSLSSSLNTGGVDEWKSNNFENQFFARGKVWINVRQAPTKLNWATFDEKKYFALADQLLNFTQNHLTCGAIVSYLLKIVGIEEPKSVLVFVPDSVDYLALTIEQGFAELGMNYTTNDHFFTKKRGEKPAKPSWAIIPTNDQLLKDREREQYLLQQQQEQQQQAGEESNEQEEKEEEQEQRNISTTGPVWPPWQKRIFSSDSSTQKMTFSDWSNLITSEKYQINKMYGNGFVWGMRSEPPPLRNSKRLSLYTTTAITSKNNNNKKIGDLKKQKKKPKRKFKKNELQRRIEAKEFDLIVYSSLFLVTEGRFHSNVSLLLPYLQTVKEAYRGEWGRVVFCDGDDAPLLPHHWGPTLEEMVNVNTNSSHPLASSKMFVRELQHLANDVKDVLPPM